MAVSDRTRIALADALKEMTETMPLSRIRVVELCKRCGVDRRTFYYHFRDIYDLTAWIFDQDVNDAIERFGGHACLEALVLALERVREELGFYRRALAEDSQNALGRHILNANVRLYVREVQYLRDTELLSREDEFAIGYHCFASLGIIRRWIFADNDLSPREVAILLIHTMPPMLRAIYQSDPDWRKEKKKYE